MYDPDNDAVCEGGGASTGVGATNLDRDHRLAHAARLGQRGDEAGAVAHRFAEQHHRRGVFVLDHVVEEVGHPQIGFVARADDITKCQARRLAAIEQRKPDTTGLRDDANSFR